jgi:glycosyltransferase involved in cell wall biosynthesis
MCGMRKQTDADPKNVAGDPGGPTVSPVQTRKPVILVLVRYYFPGHKAGGPVRSILNMVDQLSDAFDFFIVTSDRDAFDERPYPSVSVDVWNHVGKARVYYLSPRNRSIWALARLLSDKTYDVLYLNSFFDPVFTLGPLVARRLGLLPPKSVVIAPRGEFSSGALTLKRWKKTAYHRFASIFRLYRDLIWQASSEYEATDIRHVMGESARQIAVASNLALLLSEATLDSDALVRARAGPLRIVFLSRITPKKNLDFALGVLAKVQIPVQFSIYGPNSDKRYWSKCEGLIRALPSHISVQYGGVLPYSEVSTVLGTHDLLFLPTRGENYGHVIIESMIAGTPVLIANTTPWRNIEPAGVGWDLPLDNEQQFVDKIHDAANLSNKAYGLWRKRVRSYARAQAADPEIIAANKRLFAGSIRSEAVTN